MERGSGPRRDGPGARRFNGYDRPPPAPTPPAKPIQPRARPRAPRAQNLDSRNNEEVTPIGKGVPDTWPTSSDLTWVVKAVDRRSGGRCEARLDGCERGACHRHHRKRRRYGDHRPVNLAHLCNACHSFIHLNVAWATTWGWLLRSNDDPELVDQGVRRTP